jgi:hypothetical protein
MFPNFKLIVKFTVIKTVWYWPKDGLIDPQTRNENEEINPYNYRQMVFYKILKIIQWGKDWLSTIVLGQLYIHVEKRKKTFNLYLVCYTKINSKWITDPNIRT